MALATPGPGDPAAVGAMLASQDPWARLSVGADALARQFVADQPGTYPFMLRAGGRIAGGVIVRHPFLLGPYLVLIGIDPSYRRRGIGAAVLGWLEREAKAAGTRNVWLCVSGFNTPAHRFYERHGFVAEASLADLVMPHENEILMRKRLDLHGRQSSAS